MDWKSTATFESQICEGVSYQFKKFSAGRKIELEAGLAEYREQMRERLLEYADNCIINTGLRDKDGALVEADGKPVDPGDSDYVVAQKRTRQTAFSQWANSASDRFMKPQALRAYLKGIEGLSIDGAPATVETFIADGPEDLADEAYMLIQKHGGLSDAERKNSPSPIISPAAEDGPANSTTAPRAAGASITSTETAAASSI